MVKNLTRSLSITLATMMLFAGCTSTPTQPSSNTASEEKKRKVPQTKNLQAMKRSRILYYLFWQVMNLQHLIFFMHKKQMTHTT